jgi:hypothetical protein
MVVKDVVMFDNKVTDFLLKKVPQDKWNFFSNVLARFSFPTIGSPISFKCKNLYLKEFSIPTMANSMKETFLLFCYPPEIYNRDEEILLDQQYWKDAATFLVFNTSQEIVGCVQFIPKTTTNKIPVEYSHVVKSLNVDYLNITNNFKLPLGQFAEVYRFRRSFSLKGEDATNVVSILFKAIWIKTIQTSTDYLYISYNSGNHELKNLYLRKLHFQNPKVTVQFGNDPTLWNILIKDCQWHEKKFAELSKPHFFLQTWVRKNSKKLNLEAKPQSTSSPLLSEEDTILFASVVRPKRKRKTVPAAKAAKTV